LPASSKNSPFLLIFIDSFPFEILASTNYLSRFPTKKRMLPGFGYSKNILPELFAGKRPDDLGYFNEWGLGSMPSRPSSRSLSQAMVQPLHSLVFLDSAIHRAIRTVTHRYLNIPFHLYSHFVRHNASVYDGSLDTVFSLLPGLRLLLAEQQATAPGQRDRLVLATASATLRDNPCLYLSLVDLDCFAHRHGIHSPEHSAHVKYLDASIAHLVDAYRAQTDGRGKVFVFSDHGMAQVKEGVALSIEKELGPAGPSTYLYFVDSTMLRVWVFRQEWQARVESYLSSLNVGTIIPPLDRKKYGITLADTGDVFFVLNEGYVFAPSFQRYRMDAAMHGYHPGLRSQHGIFLSPDPPDGVETIASLEAHRVFETLAPRSSTEERAVQQAS